MQRILKCCWETVITYISNRMIKLYILFVWCYSIILKSSSKSQIHWLCPFCYCAFSIFDFVQSKDLINDSPCRHSGERHMMSIMYSKSDQYPQVDTLMNSSWNFQIFYNGVDWWASLWIAMCCFCLLSVDFIHSFLDYFAGTVYYEKTLFFVIHSHKRTMLRWFSHSMLKDNGILYATESQI